MELVRVWAGGRGPAPAAAAFSAAPGGRSVGQALPDNHTHCPGHTHIGRPGLGPRPPQGVVVWLLQTTVAVAVATPPLECQVSPACSCHVADVSAQTQRQEVVL